MQITLPTRFRPTLFFHRGGSGILLALLSLTSVEGFVSFGNGYGNKWGDPQFGTGAVVTWGFMSDGTGVDPGFRIDPFAFPDRSGLVGTSDITSLRNSIDTTYGANAFLEAITRAFDTWSQAANIRFVGPIVDGGLPLNDPGATGPDIRIGAFHADPDHSFRFYGAVGFAPPYNGGTLAGDILFNLDRNFQIATGIEDTTSINYTFGDDLEGLVLHELGHAAIGLGHPPSGTDAVMYVGVGCCQFLNRQLSADDIAGARFTYGLIGDLNSDGTVDAADAGIMFGNWGGSGTGDLNADSIIDAADAGVLFGAWTGDSHPTSATSQTVPEPTGGALLLPAIALGLLGRLGRRSGCAPLPAVSLRSTAG